MTEFPGLLPWHFGGDPWLTYPEAEGLMRTLQGRAKERKRAADEAKKKQPRRR